MGCSNIGKAKILSVTLFFFLFLNLVNPVHAENDVDFMNIPQQLADHLNIPLFGGQILASGIMLMIFLLPITIIARGKKAGFIPELGTTLVIYGFCTAIGWLPYWFLLILCMLIALMFAGTMRDLITGRGK